MLATNQVNKYYRRSKISETKFRQLARCFALDLTVSDTAQPIGLSRRSTGAVFLKIRRRLAEACERDAFTTSAETEIDESYFGPRRVRGKRGRGAGGKTVVFGIFEREGRVYTEVVPNVQKRTLQAIVRGCIDPGALVHSDGWGGATPQW